jgi:PilZ domain
MNAGALSVSAGLMPNRPASESNRAGCVSSAPATGLQSAEGTGPLDRPDESGNGCGPTDTPSEGVHSGEALPEDDGRVRESRAHSQAGSIRTVPNHLHEGNLKRWENRRSPVCQYDCHVKPECDRRGLTRRRRRPRVQRPVSVLPGIMLDAGLAPETPESPGTRPPRFAPRAGMEVVCRAGPGGTGRNLAVSAVDVSAGGVGLVLREPLLTGKKVVVFLRAPSGPIICRVGFIRWCEQVGDLIRAGVQFYRQLHPPELRSLI